MSDGSDDMGGADFPPLSPDGEQPAPDDLLFVKSCLAQFESIEALGNIQVNGKSLTENKTWGPVFRADFTIDGKSASGFANRLVCWKGGDGNIATMYAIGQDISSLG